MLAFRASNGRLACRDSWRTASSTGRWRTDSIGLACQRCFLRRVMKARGRSPTPSVPRGGTAAKQPGHFSTKHAASQSWSSTWSPWTLIPQATAPVAASTAWVGPTGTVLAELKTPLGRWTRDRICSNRSAPTLYRMRAPPSEARQRPPTCRPCPMQLRPHGLPGRRAAARLDGVLLAWSPAHRPHRPHWSHRRPTRPRAWRRTLGVAGDRLDRRMGASGPGGGLDPRPLKSQLTGLCKHPGTMGSTRTWSIPSVRGCGAADVGPGRGRAAEGDERTTWVRHCGVHAQRLHQRAARAGQVRRGRRRPYPRHRCEQTVSRQPAKGSNRPPPGAHLGHAQLSAGATDPHTPSPAGAPAGLLYTARRRPHGARRDRPGRAGRLPRASQGPEQVLARRVGPR
jgi:hypothetical protein